MSSGFHSDELLKSLSRYPVAKGDTPGHDFHGNQYVSMGNQAAEAQKIVDHISSANGKVDNLGVEAQHRAIASALEQTSKGLEGETGVKRLKDAIDKAAEAHRYAAAIHAAAFINLPLGQRLSPADATAKALAASLKVDKLNYS